MKSVGTRIARATPVQNRLKTRAAPAANRKVDPVKQMKRRRGIRVKVVRERMKD
jgi:hypothetical protein